MSEKEKLTYRLATGWAVKQDQGREVTILRRHSGFVRRDCETSANEDFACNIELFLSSPEKLKAIEPSAYSWIRNQFGDSFYLRK